MNFRIGLKNNNPMLAMLSLCLVIALQNQAFALIFQLPYKGGNIIGEIQIIKVQRGDTLNEIARRENIGLLELKAANPGINARNLKAGSDIVIPTAFILPNTPRNGIVINLAELRLYYFPPGKDSVYTYPIGIGKEGWETPVSVTYVDSKEEYPKWFPPESIREYTLKKKGYLLPKVVPSGPDNPLGDFAIRLALPSYLIHGTNNPGSIGKRSSSGCIRMFPEDIEELFYEVQPGTPVYIIHAPYKLGWFKKEFYIEAHKPLPQYDQTLNLNPSIQYNTRGVANRIHWDAAQKAIRELVGYPVYIGERSN